MYSDIILSMSTKGTIYSNMQFLYVLFRSAWQWPMSQYESYKPARQLRNILAHTNTISAIQCYSQAIDHHISCLQQFHQGAVPQWMDPKPVRCAKIVAQHLVRRSNFPWRSSVERRRTGATDGSHGHGGKKHGGNWTPIDTHTHMYIYIYMYIYVCLHIYVHIICICWSCPFLCVNVCVSI